LKTKKAGDFPEESSERVFGRKQRLSEETAGERVQNTGRKLVAQRGVGSTDRRGR